MARVGCRRTFRRGRGRACGSRPRGRRTIHSSVALPSGKLAVRGVGEVLRRSTSSSCDLGHRWCGGAAGWSAGAGRTHTLPCVRAFGLPGRSASSGSTTNGSGSKSISICSIASAAVSFVHRRDRQDRLALVERLVGEPALAERARDDALAEIGTFDHRRAGRRPSGSPSRRASPAPRSCRCRVTRACGIGLRSSLAEQHARRRGSPRRISPCR